MPTRGEILDALKNVEDPELFMSIVDLGLVYRVEVHEDAVEIDYTLTSPGCPLSEQIERDIHMNVEIVTELPIKPKLVWEPVWGPEYMSDEAKISLGYPI
ncbi:MAG: metal-sulfur cluster assembly factor [Spirochaetales bacterium]|jgi:metal-sulfur cluster biosynthetic enzyme|nr:metal-sulfur cluster assembly factor [Spirochaetales bacterium]